jgi:hypothetical protein
MIVHDLLSPKQVWMPMFWLNLQYLAMVMDENPTRSQVVLVKAHNYKQLQLLIMDDS